MAGGLEGLVPGGLAGRGINAEKPAVLVCVQPLAAIDPAVMDRWSAEDGKQIVVRLELPLHLAGQAIQAKELPLGGGADELRAEVEVIA